MAGPGETLGSPLATLSHTPRMREARLGWPKHFIRTTPETALQLFQEWPPSRRVACGSLTTPLDTPCYTSLGLANLALAVNAVQELVVDNHVGAGIFPVMVEHALLGHVSIGGVDDQNPIPAGVPGHLVNGGTELRDEGGGFCGVVCESGGLGRKR
jgi:hypothetical protein